MVNTIKQLTEDVLISSEFVKSIVKEFEVHTGIFETVIFDIDSPSIPIPCSQKISKPGLVSMTLPEKTISEFTNSISGE